MHDQDTIDREVIAQADDDTAWEEPIAVDRRNPGAIMLPPDLAARAAFFARLHRAPSIEAWLHRVIRERTDLEEAAYASLKRDLADRAAG